MFLIIDLRDHENRSHKSVGLKFQAQATATQLTDQISSNFAIAQNHQEIFDNSGRRIHWLDGSLENAGIRDRETLILKHSELQKWAACLTIANSVAQKKPDHLKAKFAKHGSKFLTNLENCEFFDTYPSFFDKFVELSTVFDRFVIGVEENIKIAVGSYFKKYFANEALAITFSLKPDTGAQGGFIVHVADADYFVKNHTFMGRGSARSHVDKREIFAYRLLQFIGVGADAHFIPSAYSRCYTSALALHIATKKVQGFQKRAHQSACPFTAEHQIQLDLIRKVLYLGDLNSGNYGLNEKHQLSIIDFVVLPQDNCIHSATLFEQPLDHPTLNMTIQNWNLLKNFTEATESIANDCKQMQSIIWRDGYDEYLKVVLENIKLLNNML